MTVQYLGDKSAIARLRLAPVQARLGPMIERGLVSICEATEYELLFSAKNLSDYDHIKQDFIPGFPHADMGHNPWTPALDLQRQLAERGEHRCASMVDLLIAVTAQRAGLTILHYDRDFDTIAEVTGQPTEWIVPPGTV